MSCPDSVLRDAFAPTGVLRASINFGNPILASKDEKGEPQGISVDIASELAQRLDLSLELVTYDAAGKAVAGIEAGEVDVGFFAIDPVRGKQIAFTTPYVLIQGSYLVRSESPIQTLEEVDRKGTRVAVGTGSAYDLFLTREIKHAEIVRNSTSPEVVNTFLRDGLDVAAGVTQQLEADAKRLGGLRLLDGNFMVICQSMGIAKSRGEGAAAWLDVFVSELVRSGFVADAVSRYRVDGVSVPQSS
ncbi:ABC amino acid transporter, periplasmic ligand binding protein [Caballeronia pedi]|uniref:ABC amino acid transporter, periplasmic ligand binding protein n=1 Tax=Caballeronia pedi TaxID=1777141 RepID=A0A158D3Q0_9BURK|nr:ABC transporter substrate-binding protein [Caballeronia pedi]SAK89262.1 ABC amino acid transporter, periplasmic ligand binding protein [Caballeronia pedi]